MYSAQQSYDQTQSYLSYKLYRISNVAGVISFNRIINSILSKDPDNYDSIDQVKDYQDLQYLLSNFEDKEIIHVRLYLNDNFYYSEENVNLFGIGSIVHTKWHDYFMKSDSKVLFCPKQYLDDTDAVNTEKGILSIARKIINFDNLNQIIGFLRVDFYESDIRSIIQKANSTNNSLTYLHNSDGVVVSSSDEQLYGQYEAYLNDINQLSCAVEFKEIEVAEEKILVRRMQIPETDWYMTTITPLYEILSKVNVMRTQIFLIVMVMGILAYVIAFFISKSVTKRMSLLICKMGEVQNGNFNPITDISAKDEVGQLAEKFNFMLEKITVFIEEQYRAGREIKNAELKALQSQINPHFLYNTLDMINWLSKSGRVSDIEVATLSLANFYRLSLNKGEDITSIGNELMHISSYVKIQNIRFRDSLNLQIHIPDELLDFDIPKITLQPIIENSILHGILPKDNPSGLITVNGWIKDKELYISVKDNGVGISEENLCRLFTGHNKGKAGCGYGVYNIRERIRLIYGEKYGISFKSILGSGTSVEILIPAMKEDEHE